MYKKLSLSLILMIILFPLGQLFAQEQSDNQFIRCIKIEDKDTSLGGCSDVYVEWKVGTLMGEPIISSRGIVSIPFGFSAPKQWVTYRGKEYSVPTEIVKKITVISTDVAIEASYYLYMDFDLGAMGDIYWGGTLVPALSADEKEKYFSFNVSGSPEWDDLFYNHNKLTDEKKYLSEEEAKKIFIGGFVEKGNPSTARVKFNLSPIRNWIENVNKTIVRNKVGDEDPFKKFEAMGTTDKIIKKINDDIEHFITDRCGTYYTQVAEKKEFTGFHLYRDIDYSRETKEERRHREKRDKEYRRKKAEEEKQSRKRVQAAMREAVNDIPRLQSIWKENRNGIKSECRSFIMKKYAFEVSTQKLEELLNNNFKSTENFEGIYYVPHDER